MTEVGVIPEDWNVVSLNDVCIKIQDGTHFSPKPGGNDYYYITSKNIAIGHLDLSDVSRIDALQHRNIYKRCDVKVGDLLLTKDGVNTGNAAMNDLDEEFSLLSSVAMLRFHISIYHPQYFMYQILSDLGQNRIRGLMSGNAITRLTLEKIRLLRFPSPTSLDEQRCISGLLSDIDSLITSLEKLIGKKKLIKQGAMQELLTGKKRLPGFSGKWETKTIDDIFSYERPDKYIHWDTDLENIGSVPVLTANKSFILGYAKCADGICSNLPAIIFDDFTTDSKFVSFPFKVKSSAIKILRTKHRADDLRFIHGLMKLIKFSLGGHKRYYLSEYRHLEVIMPSSEEQKAISDVLESMDSEIKALTQQLSKYRLIKEGMMQELLTGRIRLI